MPEIHFHVGHNLAGHLPESGAACFKPGEDGTAGEAAASAVLHLGDEAREYADQDDEAVIAALPGDPQTAREHGYTVTPDGIEYGDDWPSMRATVDSILADDGPQPGKAFGMTVTDGSGRAVHFFISLVPAPDCEEPGQAGVSARRLRASIDELENGGGTAHDLAE